jgi:hypothetical protein
MVPAFGGGDALSGCTTSVTSASLAAFVFVFEGRFWESSGELSLT